VVVEHFRPKIEDPGVSDPSLLLPRALFTVTTPTKRNALNVPGDNEVRIDRRATRLRVAQVHVFAANPDVELAGQIPLESNPSTELHPSATQSLPSHHRGAHQWGIEPNGPVDASSELGNEKCRMRPPEIVALPEKTGSLERTVESRRSAPPDRNRARRGKILAGSPDSRHLRHEARFVRLERHRSVNRQLRVFSGQLQILTRTTFWSKGQSNRSRIVNRVVEQRDVQRVDSPSNKGGG